MPYAGGTTPTNDADSAMVCSGSGASSRLTAIAGEGTLQGSALTLTHVDQGQSVPIVKIISSLSLVFLGPCVCARARFFTHLYLTPNRNNLGWRLTLHR